MENVNIPITSIRVRKIEISNYSFRNEPTIEVIYELLSANGKEIGTYKCSSSKSNVMNYPKVDFSIDSIGSMNDLIKHIERDGRQFILNEFNMIEAGSENEDDNE